MGIGEAGSITRGGFGANEQVRIDFTDPIANAVIILTGTNAGGNEYALVVTSVDADGFTFNLDEWEGEDGPHPATETINWIAVTPGVHSLPDGRLIEVGTTTAGTTATSVSLNGTYVEAPVVLTSRMSTNDANVADSDPFNITTTGFDVALQEGTLGDGVNTGETVGYVVISKGGDATSGTAVSYNNLTTSDQTFALDATFTQGITLADTQTMNETDAGVVHLTNNASESEVLARFDEQSGSNAHLDEGVGFLTFENGIIPCYTKGTKISTLRGQIDVSELRVGDRILTRDNGFQALRWLSKTQVGQARLAADPALAPIQIKRDALGPGLPAADMWVSPQHRMLMTGWKAELLSGQSEVLVPARALLNDRDVLQTPVSEATYYHLLLDRHEVIYANETPSESLHASQMDLSLASAQQRHELNALVPDLHLGFGAATRECLTVSQGRAYAA